MNRPSSFAEPLEIDSGCTSELRIVARELQREREERNWFVPHSLLDEAAWDILLDLYASGDAALAALVEKRHTSLATTERWIASLVHEGLVRRQVNSDELALTAKARRSLSRYLADLHERRRRRYQYGLRARSTRRTLLTITASAVVGSALTFTALTFPALAIWIGAVAVFLTVAALLFGDWLLRGIPESTGL
jgi:DNA-binding MarR family transcriptional regulator